MHVPDYIFKSYDIRGIYPSEVNAEIAHAVGNRLVGFLNAQKVLVLHDARNSGPELLQAVVDGIEKAGSVAIVAGMGPTDLFYYGCGTLNCPGIMVTASHNPSNQNGFKIVRKMPFALSYEEGLSELRRRIKEEPEINKVGGRAETVDLGPGFVEFMAKTVGDFKMPRGAVADPGNGASGPLLLQIRDRLNLDIDVINMNPDGSFPARGPDPTKSGALQGLSDRVIQDKAMIGVALDGDGDRAVVVGPDGNPLPGDFTAALMARHALKIHPGQPVIADVRCSRAVRETVLACGGKPMVGRVGHVYMKKLLYDVGAAFAGEVSGHYYFPEFFGADSGLLSALYMVRLASEMGEGWAPELQRLRNTYHVSGEINFRVADTGAKLELLRAKYPSVKPSDLDGETYDFGDWWFNVRKSNTEPLLRLNLEASSPESLKQHLSEVSALLGESN